MVKNTSKLILLLITGLLWAGPTQAQESVNAMGGDATGSGGTLAFSVGQVVYTSNTNNSGTLSQGVQQAYEIFTVGIEETELDFKLSLFPNPTTKNLTLQISDYNNENLSYQLFDVHGKLLNHGPVNTQQTQINTVNLPPASYLVKVTNHKTQKVQSFTVIKK